jgi:hypothetical protein
LSLIKILGDDLKKTWSVKRQMFVFSPTSFKGELSYHIKTLDDAEVKKLVTSNGTSGLAFQAQYL